METVVQLGNGEQTTSLRMSCSGSAYSKSVERRMKLRLRFYHMNCSSKLKLGVLFSSNLALGSC